MHSRTPTPDTNATRGRPRGFIQSGSLIDAQRLMAAHTALYVELKARINNWCYPQGRRKPERGRGVSARRGASGARLDLDARFFRDRFARTPFEQREESLHTIHE